MKKISIYALCFIGGLFFVSCTFNGVYLNRASDVSDGKVALNKLYNQIGQKNFNIADDMLSDSLKATGVSAGQLSKILKFVNSKVGDFKSYKIVDSLVKRVVGSINETSYSFKLKVTYQKGTVDEVVGFQKQNNSGIKLYGYHVNSDLLMP